MSHNNKNTLNYLYLAYKEYEKYLSVYKQNNEKDNLSTFFELPTFHYTQIDSINNCNSDIVVISNDTESLHSRTYFKQYNNDKFYVIISADDWDTKKYDIGINQYINITHWFDIFDLMNRHFSFYNFEFWMDKEYVFDYPKKYDFLSLIGNERPERDLFFSKLKEKTKFSNSIVKYSGQNYGEISHLDVSYNKPGEFDPYMPINRTNFHNVSNTIPIDMYNQANFQIVVETDLTLENFAPTEKIFKCLLTGMPFVVVGSYNLLKNLRKLGFTTYNELWDESYDNIYCFEERAEKVCNIIKKLETFDWQKNADKLEVIAAKNARNIINCNRHFIRFFKDLEKVVEDLKL